VLTWLEGKDLHSVRERYPEGLPSEPATWIFRRTLSALGYAHSLGVVHGNVTPAHILVSPEDHNIFLVDWCFAAVRPAETGDRFVYLDEVYSPPEVEERRPPLPSSDLFSLARSIVYLLGGDPESETLPEGIEEPFERLLRYFLRKSAIQRPQDAWQMYQELDILRRELFGEHRFRELEL
jgi:serine/threonine protein kinase